MALKRNCCIFVVGVLQVSCCSLFLSFYLLETLPFTCFKELCSQAEGLMRTETFCLRSITISVCARRVWRAAEYSCGLVCPYGYRIFTYLTVEQLNARGNEISARCCVPVKLSVTCIRVLFINHICGSTHCKIPPPFLPLPVCISERFIQ